MWKTIQNQFVCFGSELALFSSSLISLMNLPCYMFLITRISHFFAILAAFGHFCMWGHLIIFMLNITRLLKTTFFIMENIIFHASLVQTLEIIAKKQGKIFVCLFSLSVKFFIQISKWFLGPTDVNKWVLFHVKWYPQGWGSAVFFPCVRWSNVWLPICSGSWSPKPALPFWCPQLSPVFLLGQDCVGGGVWDLCCCSCPDSCVVSLRLHLTKGCSFPLDWQKFPCSESPQVWIATPHPCRSKVSI